MRIRFDKNQEEKFVEESLSLSLTEKIRDTKRIHETRLKRMGNEISRRDVLNRKIRIKKWKTRRGVGGERGRRRKERRSRRGERDGDTKREHDVVIMEAQRFNNVTMNERA